MSIFGPANTVTAADIALLEDSLQFFQSSASNQSAVAGAIQAGNTTVAAYAAQLLNANISFSQVAMGVSCIELGVAQTTAELDNLSTVFLPAQVQNAINHGFNPTVYAAEATGLALAGEPEFAAFTGLNAAQFTITVSGLTGVSQSVIQTWVTNWTHFYTPVAQGGLGGSTFGLSVTAAAYGAALGDAVGVALLNPTSAGLQTVTSTNAQGETSIQGDVANHLLDIATGQYVPGTDCDLLPQHTPLQGEVGSGLRLTINVDNLTATSQLAVFDASPASNPPLGTDNTLNSGDNLQDPFGDGTLEFITAQVGFPGGFNPAFAQNVTMNGIATANILSQDLGGNFAGFSGAILGLTDVTLRAGSTTGVELGDFNVGLLTPLVNINIDASQDFIAHIASAAFVGGEAVNINLGGVFTFVTLDVESGANFYAQVDVHSLVADNELGLFTNADTIATVTVDGAENLTMHSNSFHNPIFPPDDIDDESALNVANLHLFDASAAQGDITVGQKCVDGGLPEIGFFGTGDIQVLGGSGNDFFVFHTDGAVDVQGNDGDDQFTFQTERNDETTFTAADSADGGAGINQLNLEAYRGELLQGGTIANIQTIEHYTGVGFNFTAGMADDLTVDMSQAGSATTLDLAGDYFDFQGNNPGTEHDVTVSNLTNADTVVYSGINLDTLTLVPSTPLGIVNFTMAQDLANTCLDTVVNGANYTNVPDHILEVLDVDSILLNLHSTGNATTNVVEDTSLVDANVNITGDVNLDFAPAINLNSQSYDVDNGIIDASTFTGDLDVSVGNGSQTVIGGLGDDYIETFSANAPDLIVLDIGGSDTVEFESTFTGNDQPVTNANYTLVTGFDVADDQINLDVENSDLDDLSNTFTGIVVAPGNSALPFVYTTNTVVDADLPPGFNFIKVDTPINLLDTQDAQVGFNEAMGGVGSIDIVVGTDDYLFAYFDATHQQMVLGVVEDPGGVINAGDDFDVISLISMSKTDYDAFGAANIGFVNT